MQDGTNLFPGDLRSIAYVNTQGETCMIDLAIVPLEDYLGVAGFVGLDSQTRILLDAVDHHLFALQVGVFVLLGVHHARDSWRLLI